MPRIQLVKSARIAGHQRRVGEIVNVSRQNARALVAIHVAQWAPEVAEELPPVVEEQPTPVYAPNEPKPPETVTTVEEQPGEALRAPPKFDAAAEQTTDDDLVGNVEDEKKPRKTRTYNRRDMTAKE